jgi:hypothetical protein
MLQAQERRPGARSKPAVGVFFLPTSRNRVGAVMLLVALLLVMCWLLF